MLYTVYKTTNLANGKYYFGVHKTKDPNDSYLGSGKLIRRAVAKHGEHNFRKDVLFTYLDPESAFAKEDELIQCYRGLDPLCINLRKGGSGGFDWINKNGLNGATLAHIAEVEIKRHRTRREKVRGNPQLKEKLRQQMLSIGKLVSKKTSVKNAAIGRMAWTGRKHTADARKRMSVSHRKPTGARWMCRIGNVQRVPKVRIADFVKNGWIFGRKV